jgi:hypothetical protein
LLLASIGAILVGLAMRSRGKHAAVRAVVLAVVLVWLAQAGVDWLWELPAVSVWVFAAAGAALAADRGRRRTRYSLPARAVVCFGVAALALVPALIASSQRQIDEAVEAFQRDDCPSATQDARDAIAVLDIRPNAHEVIGYCAARGREHGLAVRSLERAVELDPDNWEYRYGLALVQAAAGLDPRPAAQSALRLNPRDAVPLDAVVRFMGDQPRMWRRAAREPLRSRLLVR